MIRSRKLQNPVAILRVPSINHFPLATRNCWFTRRRPEAHGLQPA
jgi:hypothetical protein